MTTASPVRVRVSHHFDAPPERVFDAWLDPATAGRWLFATDEGEMKKVEIDPRVGGGFTIVELRGDQDAFHSGRYVELERPRRLAFDFATDPDEPHPSRVEVAIEPDGDGCELVLVHDIRPEWADWAERTRQGWEKILAGLEAHLERRARTGRQSQGAEE